jgi:hypothetical protein
MGCDTDSILRGAEVIVGGTREIPRRLKQQGVVETARESQVIRTA